MLSAVMCPPAGFFTLRISPRTSASTVVFSNARSQSIISQSSSTRFFA